MISAMRALVPPSCGKTALTAGRYRQLALCNTRLLDIRRHDFERWVTYRRAEERALFVRHLFPALRMP